MNQLYFGDTDKAARKPTEDVTQYLESLGYQVKNCEQNWLYRLWDVDLLVFQGKRMYMVEIKADSHNNSPNLFMETISNDVKNTPGCMLATRSDYIIYYYERSRELVTMETKPMQAWLRENMHKYRSISVATGNKDGSDTWYRSHGILVRKSVIVSQEWADSKII